MKLFVLVSPVLAQTLSKIANSDIATVSAKTLYKANKLTRKLAEYSKDFEEIRSKLIQKYAKKDENGQVIITKDDKNMDIATFEQADIELFNKEFSDLMNCDVDEDFKIKFDIADFEKLTSFTGQDLQVLMDAGLVTDSE